MSVLGACIRWLFSPGFHHRASGDAAAASYVGNGRDMPGLAKYHFFCIADRLLRPVRRLLERNGAQRTSRWSAASTLLPALPAPPGVGGPGLGCHRAEVVHRTLLPLSDSGSRGFSVDLGDWLEGQSMAHVRGARYHSTIHVKIEHCGQSPLAKSISKGSN
jgi:hypothetical protein